MFKSHFVLFSFLLIVVCWAGGTSVADISQQFAQAQNYQKLKNYTAAQIAYTSIVQAQPVDLHPKT